MTQKAGALALLLALLLAVLFGALNAVLAVDLALRIWTVRSGFARPLDAELLILVELARAVATLLLLAAAVRFGVARTRCERALGLGIALLAIAFVQAFTFPGFPGHLQEALARGLLGAGVPRGVLVLLFGTPAWALWLALGAALRAGTPDGELVERDPGANERAGAAARRGLLHGNAVAGLDIGKLFERAAAAAVARGWLRGAVVWAAVFVLMALHVGVGGVVVLPLAALWAIGAGVAVSLLRAIAARPGEASATRTVQLHWLACAAVAAVAGLLVGGALVIVLPGADRASLVVLAAAPLAVAACVWAAAFARRGPRAHFGGKSR